MLMLITLTQKTNISYRALTECKVQLPMACILMLLVIVNDFPHCNECSVIVDLQELETNCGNLDLDQLQGQIFVQGKR